tara:strand:- start:140 stop:388 length:249 start_codon:yes stop_codon:yes gene_type:complete
MKRVVFNLKSYLKTGRTYRSKSREIIAQALLVSDVLASVEREERNVRLGEHSVIGASTRGRRTLLPISFSGESVMKRLIQNY